MISLQHESVITAHRGVWEACKLLHCDVSVGNILIHSPRDCEDPETNEVAGLLADWDLAKTEEELTTRSVSLQWPSSSRGY